MQVGVFDGSSIPPVSGAQKLLSNVSLLIERAREAAVPIIFVQHKAVPGHPLEYQTEGWHIDPEMGISNESIVVEKQTPDSFYNTDLQENLLARKINRLILAGIQTEFCVDTTCRQAFSLDYEVTLAEDAHSTWDTDQLSASQIINHHNFTLSEWFVSIKRVNDIDFDQAVNDR